MKMVVDEEFVRRVAANARLTLSDSEVTQYAEELKEVLGAFEQLDSIDVADLKPMMQPVSVRNALREDVETACLSQDQALQLAEHTKDGYFKGPKII